MDKQFRKGFVARYSKSSALIVSVAIHLALILVAISFVAVSVVVRHDPTFKVQQVNRPQMHLNKLRVPVKMKKLSRQPKLRRQIIAKPKINNMMADIKMPEIVGVKGGLGGDSGFGGSASLGFSMPQINLFGVKSRSEKVFFALDASDHMMVDKIGGVRSYEIIKSEMIRILKQLNSTVLFNVVVYQDYSAKMLFPKMVPANSENVSKAVAWLKPLNRFEKGRNSQQQYGSKTTGKGGTGLDSNNQIDPLKGNVSHWASPVMEAMKEQADSVFVLTSGWGFLAYKTAKAAGWSAAAEARFQKKVAEAKQKLKEDNARRAAAGNPPRIIPKVNFDRNVVQAYFPSEPLPPYAHYTQYTPRQMVKAFINMRAKNVHGTKPVKLGVSRKGRGSNFTINVIQFCKEGESKNDNFVKLTNLLNGEYRLIAGAKAIQSYVK